MEICNRNFPSVLENTGSVGIELHRFPKDVTTKEVLELFEYRGVRPAKPAEVLALSIAYPDLQGEYRPIIALGQTWSDRRGRRYALCLDRVGVSERRARLVWFDGLWYQHSRFAALRNFNPPN